MPGNLHEIENRTHGCMNIQERHLLSVMDRLIIELDGLQRSFALRQMWLETQWLKQNLLSERLVMPEWQLLIYKPPIELSEHPEAKRYAKQLATELSRYCGSSKASSRQ